jgi:hypothetical protein
MIQRQQHHRSRGEISYVERQDRLRSGGPLRSRRGRGARLVWRRRARTEQSGCVTSSQRNRSRGRDRLLYPRRSRGRSLADRRDPRRRLAEGGLALDGRADQGTARLAGRVRRLESVRRRSIDRDRERQPARPGRAAHPGAVERPPGCAESSDRRRRRHQPVPGRRDRAYRGSQGRRGRNLRLGCDRRRRELHHQERLRRTADRRLLQLHRGLRRRLQRQRGLGLARREHGCPRRSGLSASLRAARDRPRLGCALLRRQSERRVDELRQARRASSTRSANRWAAYQRER